MSPQAPLIEYVIVFAPAEANAGLNVPFIASVIPVPLHVPPALAADNVIGSSAIQNGPAGVIVPNPLYFSEELKDDIMNYFRERLEDA